MAKKRNAGKPPLTEQEKMQAKRDNFARLLPQRMDKALRSIRMVADCSSVNYSYTTEQAQFIVAELRAAVDSVEKRYAGEPGKSSIFKFPE